MDDSYARNTRVFFSNIASQIPQGNDRVVHHFLQDHAFISYLIEDFDALLSKRRYILVAAILRMISDRVIEDCWIASNPSENTLRVALKTNKEFIKTVQEAKKAASMPFEADDPQTEQFNDVKTFIENLMAIGQEDKMSTDYAPSLKDMSQQVETSEGSLLWLYYKAFRYFSSVIHFNPESKFLPLEMEYCHKTSRYKFCRTVLSDEELMYILSALLYFFCEAISQALKIDISSQLKELKIGINRARNTLFQPTIIFTPEQPI